ncbi:MAG: DUF4349 domain-containing protein [Leucobacter sp.]
MKPRRLSLLIAALLAVAPLSACSAASGGAPAPKGVADGGADSTADFAGDSAFSEQAAVAEDAVGAEKSAESASADNRSVIRTGDISLAVSDPAKTADEVAEVAKRFKGTVESSTVTGESEDYSASANVTLRVPEDRLDEAFDALTELGEVVSESRSELDVTTEHVDLKARVAALEKSVDRLTDLMSGANSTNELLKAEKALSQRQQELDGMKAQLKSLEGQVSEATIFVDITEKTEAVLPGGGPANFWEGVVAGFNSLGTVGAGALVVIGVLLPWLVVGAVIALIVFGIVFAANKRRRSARTAAQQASLTQPAVSAQQASPTQQMQPSAPVAQPGEAPYPTSPTHPGQQAASNQQGASNQQPQPGP